jgi:hypothetical protein
MFLSFALKKTKAIKLSFQILSKNLFGKLNFENGHEISF